MSSLFGGGLGGDAGHAVIVWFDDLIGGIATALVLLVLVFAHWFAVGMERKQDEAEESVSEGMDDASFDLEVDDMFVADDAVVETEVEPEMVPGMDIEPVDDLHETQNELPEEAEGVVEVIRGEELSVDIKEELPPFDNRLDLERFEAPSLDLLNDYTGQMHVVSQAEIDKNNNRIRATLTNHRIEVEKVEAVVGATVTLYKVFPAPGVRVASIQAVHREVAMSLGVDGLRVVMLPDSVGFEVPNSNPSIVPLKAMLNSSDFRNSKAELPVAIGYTITQEVKTFDLTDAPHLLVAGATKQGKSVGLNVIISSLLYSKHPSELKFVFVDPKKKILTR